MRYTTLDSIKDFICKVHIAKQFQITYGYNIYRTHMDNENIDIKDADDIVDTFMGGSGFTSSENALADAKLRIASVGIKEAFSWAVEVYEESRIDKRTILIETFKRGE